MLSSSKALESIIASPEWNQFAHEALNDWSNCTAAQHTQVERERDRERETETETETDRQTDRTGTRKENFILQGL